MKKSLLLWGLLLLPWMLSAQNDAENQKKYWKLRHQFREKYIKIGDGPGESLPAWYVNPTVCIDNINFNGQGFGEMHWGDGMIHQGYYIGFLATEYRLLKNNNKDVTGVLNELFFALYAINRVDLDAEPSLNTIYNITQPQSLNGFYIREDVGEDFALNWVDENTECRCTNSNFYVNNNAGKVDDGADLVAKGNSYQNVPSLDQLTALMIGFSLVHKLVDPNEFVQPPGMSYGYNIRNENAAITNRIVSYIANHNWFLIDVNGWPATNGGSDVLFSAYPLLQAAERITGLSYNKNWNRRSIPYAQLQQCYTGYGTNGEGLDKQLEACEKVDLIGYAISFLGFTQLAKWNQAKDMLEIGVPAGPLNNQSTSAFQTWQNSGDFHGTTDFTLGLWTDKVPNEVPDISTSSVWENMFNTLNPQTQYYDPIFDSPDGNDTKPWIKDYNMTIIYNLGTASGLWNSVQSRNWANVTGNFANELTNAVLNNQVPSRPRSYFTSKLDALTYAGPYYFEQDLNNNLYERGHPDGWKSKYRWTHPDESINGSGGEQGMFDGLDYMIFHNLIQLAFPTGAVALEEGYTCDCSEPNYIYTTGMSGDELTASNILNNRMSYMSNCETSVLDPINNDVTGVFEVKPKFNNYASLGINPPKYQRVPATIEPLGKLDVFSNLVLCGANANLTIQNTGELTVENGAKVILTKAQQFIDNRGTIRVKTGGILQLNEYSKLNLLNGSKLILEDGAIVEINASQIRFNNGAEIINLGASIIKINGGQIVLPEDNTTFKINNNSSSTSAKLWFTSYCNLNFAGDHCKFEFKGKYNGEQFIELKNNATVVAVNVNFDEIGSQITFENMGVRMNENTLLELKEIMNAKNTLFQGFAINKGVSVYDINSFYGCTLNDVPLNAPLNIKNKSHLLLTNSILNSTFKNANYNYLVKVTGQRIYASNTNFNAYTGTCILSNSCITPPLIDKCNFTRSQSSVNPAPLGINDESITEVIVKSSNFTNMSTGVQKKYGKLTLRCNSFVSPLGSNVNVSYSILNMSATTSAGYNSFGFSSTGEEMVKLNTVDLLLDNGYNRFYTPTNASQKYISGTLSSPTCYVQLGCVKSMNKNQWGTSSSTIPPSNRFGLSFTNGYPAIPATSPNFAYPACGTQDPPVNPPGGSGSGGSGKSNEDETVFVSPYINTIYGDSIQLLDLQYYAMSKMSIYNDHANDLEAMDVLDAILTSGLSLEDEENYYLMHHAAVLMKSAFESAFAEGLVQGEKHIPSFDKYGQKYVNALNLLTSESVDRSNYKSHFFVELDKVELFRMLDKPEVSKEILQGLEF